MNSVRVERDGAVLRVTLARPERRNAFDAATIAELTAAFAGSATRAPSSSQATGRVLRGRRHRVAALLDPPDRGRERRRRGAAPRDVRGGRRCAAPGVARIHGYALGGGSGLAVAPT